MRIRVIYDPFLRRSLSPVVKFDSVLKTEAEEMLKLMKNRRGMGLSANQVGLDKQLIVMERPADEDLPAIPRTILSNPKIVKFSREKEELIEGCLSLPGLELPVVRHLGVTVEARTLEGKPIKIRVKGLIARIIQHEVDHLQGILFTDRVKNFRSLSDYRFAKIVFFGSDKFSLTFFEGLVEAGLTVQAVITEADKPSGRGRQVTPSLVKRSAQKYKLGVFQPTDKEEITEIIRQLKPDLIILASYGKILPSSTLEIPIYGSLNIHPSLLPKYRGSTPIQTAILRGEKETGLTVMTMVAEVDAGQIISQRRVSIEPTDTTESLREKLAALGSKLLLKELPVYLSGQAKLKAQDPSQVSSTRKLNKEMAEINWADPPEVIERQIRAFDPWPGSFTYLGNKRLLVRRARLVSGRLRFKEVQLEGKPSADWDDFVRGHRRQLTETSWFERIV